jgi:hypothetical protein
MGPASSWAFCRRVLALVGKHLPEANNEPPPWHLDGVAFRLQWRPLMPEEQPDVSNLPPSDYAFFLVQTARFYLGPLANLIDEAEFLQHFKELYQDASAKAASCRLWYAQYLLMIAFGKAFLGGKSVDGRPPGYQYAARAMPLMPELAGIALDPVLSAQALTLAALYFQSIDMRVAAYQHVSTALVLHTPLLIGKLDRTSTPHLRTLRLPQTHARGGCRSATLQAVPCNILGCLHARPGIRRSHWRNKFHTR